MSSDDAGLEILLPHECLQLLDGHVPKVGRVGVIHDNRPDVLPVNYAIVDDAVVFRTGAGEKLAATLDGDVRRLRSRRDRRLVGGGVERRRARSRRSAAQRRGDQPPEHCSHARGSPRNGPTTSASWLRASPAEASTPVDRDFPTFRRGFQGPLHLKTEHAMRGQARLRGGVRPAGSPETVGRFRQRTTARRRRHGRTGGSRPATMTLWISSRRCCPVSASVTSSRHVPGCCPASSSSVRVRWRSSSTTSATRTWPGGVPPRAGRGQRRRRDSRRPPD